MAKVALTDLYDHTVLELPKCPKPIIMQEILNVLVDFFVRSQLMFEELDAIIVRDGEDTYDLDAPATTNIDTIRWVTLNEYPLYPVRDYTMPSKSKITLVTEPTADTASDEEGLIVTVVLKPKRTITDIDADLFESWYLTWAAGVKALLMLQVGKKWSAPQTGASYGFQYEDGVANAIIERDRRGMNTQLVSQAPIPWV